MTEQELSKMISEFLPYPAEGQHHALKQFAALVAAAEREECAKVCGELADDAAKCQDFHAISALEEAMSAIRARGSE